MLSGLSRNGHQALGVTNSSEFIEFTKIQGTSQGHWSGLIFRDNFCTGTVAGQGKKVGKYTTSTFPKMLLICPPPPPPPPPPLPQTPPFFPPPPPLPPLLTASICMHHHCIFSAYAVRSPGGAQSAPCKSRLTARFRTTLPTQKTAKDHNRSLA